MVKVMNKLDEKEIANNKGAYRKSKQIIAKREDKVNPNTFLYV